MAKARRPDRPALANPALDDKLSSLLHFDVPLASATDVAQDTHALLLDVRQAEEYATSHIAGARLVKPDAPLPTWLDTVSRQRQIIVYCSVGYRSEQYGRRLRAAGFTEVYNLYGSLFEWAERKLPLVDSTGQPTSAVHTYNQRWSQWVLDTNIRKIW